MTAIPQTAELAPTNDFRHDTRSEGWGLSAAIDRLMCGRQLLEALERVLADGTVTRVGVAFAVDPAAAGTPAVTLGNGRTRGGLKTTGLRFGD